MTGCYHAQVTTGLAPSAQVIEQSFASSWIYGLVPPPVVDASACANGVARVETQLSFVNQLVNFLTLGIYTPMSIRVTCAAGGTSAVDTGASLEVAAAASQEEIGAVLTAAAEQAVATGDAVFVRFLY